jgi:hypothetical protein
MIEVEITCHTEHLAEVLARLTGTYTVKPGAEGLSVLRARLPDAVWQEDGPIMRQMGLEKKVTASRSGCGDMGTERTPGRGYPLASLPPGAYSGPPSASYSFRVTVSRRGEG